MIRRDVSLWLTTKDVNKFMVAILKDLDNAPAGEAGERVRAFLAEQETETREWPTDAHLRSSLPEAKLDGHPPGATLRRARRGRAVPARAELQV